MDRIRAERQRLRSFPNLEEDSKHKNDNSGYDDIVNKDRREKVSESSKNVLNNNKEDLNIITNNNKRTIENSKKSIEILKEIGGIDKLLTELKRSEPSSDNRLFRLAIIAYEIGDLYRSIVYATRFKDDEKVRLAHLANDKLALADVLTQLYLLCVSLEWDFNKLRELGVLHLQERHEDFKRDGWKDVK